MLMHHVRSCSRSDEHTNQVSFSGKKPAAGGTKILLIGLKNELSQGQIVNYIIIIIVTSIFSNITLSSSILQRDFMITKSDEECPVSEEEVISIQPQDQTC